MYVKEIFVKDVGPLDEISISLPVSVDGKPMPIVLLGTNGSGKTNVLSIVADSIFESAAQGYSDVLLPAPAGRNYFRLLGPAMVRAGATGSLSIVKTEHQGTDYFFVERNGSLAQDEALAVLPPSIQPAVAAAWPNGVGPGKRVSMSSAESKTTFEHGAYCYFPSSRAEKPDWLNNSGIRPAEFPDSLRLTGQLQKPLFVESGISELAQWIMSVILESRSDVAPTVIQVEGSPSVALVSQVTVPDYLRNRSRLTAANTILAAILGEPDAHFVWIGRQSSSKIGIAIGADLKAQSLHALSAGQATLLNIFGALLRYADWSRANESTTTEDVSGICIVDEIDAHMHIELQHVVIPRLMSLFPNVQFIVSCHSPLSVLGISSSLPGAKLVGLPTGREVDAEAYSEFDHALRVLKGTRAFASEVAQTASQDAGKLLVWMEGETDPIYLTAACKKLQRVDVLEKIEFAWIGAKEEGKQTNFHSGKDALNHTLSFLLANPSVVKRSIVLLYDCDANKPNLDEGTIHVRCLAQNSENTVVRVGIENLLPIGVFTDEMFEMRTVEKPNGSTVTTRDLRKVQLCQKLSEDGTDPAVFAHFGPVLDTLEVLLD